MQQLEEQGSLSMLTVHQQAAVQQKYALTAEETSRVIISIWYGDVKQYCIVTLSVLPKSCMQRSCKAQAHEGCFVSLNATPTLSLLALWACWKHLELHMSTPFTSWGYHLHHEGLLVHVTRVQQQTPRNNLDTAANQYRHCRLNYNRGTVGDPAFDSMHGTLHIAVAAGHHTIHVQPPAIVAQGVTRIRCVGSSQPATTKP